MIRHFAWSTAIALLALSGAAGTAYAGCPSFVQGTAPPLPDLASFTLTPSTIKAGQTSQGRFTLDRPEKFDISVLLTSHGRVGVSVPSCVRVRAGATSGTFTVTTSASMTSLPDVVLIQGQVDNGGALWMGLDPFDNAGLGILPPGSTAPPPPPPPPSPPPPGPIPPPTTDKVTVTIADWTTPGRLRVEATSTSPSATLTAFETGTNRLLGTLTSAGGGRFRGEFTTPLVREIRVESTAGGRAVQPVRAR